MNKLLSLSTALLTALITPAANASNPHQRINEVTQFISQTQASIASKKNKIANLNHQIQQSDLSIERINKAILRLQKQLKNKRHSLAELEQKITINQHTLAHNQAALAQQIRLLYDMKQASIIKTVLNREDPSTIQRHLQYIRVLNQQQHDQILASQAIIAQLKRYKQQAKMTRRQLTTLITKKQQQRQLLTASLATQKKNAMHLAQKVNKQSVLVAQLTQEKKSLQVIIEKLENKKSLTAVHFAKHRGDYAWPIKGRLIAAFGSPMAQGKIFRQGVVLAGKTGAPVKAIAAGQVVFAKWLKGFGLLIIINHGDGYMSLYGRNQTITKQQDDWVQAGDVIATVGQSGGFTNPGLYFGIRYKGKAQNPQKWIRR